MSLAYDRLGSGPPLVLLHGVGHRRQAWRAVCGLLAQSRELFLIDLPGHGESPALAADGRPVVTAMVESVLSLLDELGLDRPHVAGNSLGGRLALEAGVAGRASSVTALSPAGFFRGRADISYARGVFKIMQATGKWLAPAAPGLLQSTAARAVAFSAIVARPSRLTPEQAAADTAAFVLARPTLQAVLAGLGNFTGHLPAGVPVTIGWGAKDRLLSRHQALVAQRQLPDARFVLLPGCGHVPMTDDPALVASVLLGGSIV
ncbi:MAG TPA: alpha/beta fold hydrolase [Streptosporangiaceae bacterium]